MINQLLFQTLPEYAKLKFQSYSESNPLEYNDLIKCQGFIIQYDNNPEHNDCFSLYTKDFGVIGFKCVNVLNIINGFKSKYYEIYQIYNGLCIVWTSEYIVKDNMTQINFYLDDRVLKDNILKRYFSTELIEKFLPIIDAAISKDKKIITLK